MESTIQAHFDLLFDKYNLNNLYKKFLFLSMLSTAVREGFYWSLILFSEIVKNKPNAILTFSIILISLLGLHIPLERYFNNVKSKLIKKIKLSNNNYFDERIVKMNKKDVLNFDLVEYFNVLEQFNTNIETYILNVKNKYDIPIRCITLIVVAWNKNNGLLIGLFAIFVSVIKVLNEYKLINEISLTKQYFHYETLIRNYIINSKSLLINDELNYNYLSQMFNNFEKVNYQITELNHKLDMNVNISMFVFIIIIIWAQMKNLNHYDFYYYFLVIYDVEFISDKVNEYYKNKAGYTKMQERLNYLNTFKPIITNNEKPTSEPTIIKVIKIEQIINAKPKLTNTKPIIINQNDHILVNGVSGSGKTSLLYLLKGIIKPDVLKIEPSIEIINSQTFLTLPNYKGLFNGKLYDIITNYELEPNVKMIETALVASKIQHKFNNNDDIDINKLSGGEQLRLLIARIIYTVKTKNFNILLFDEIDDNLNNQLAEEICTNLRDIFKDKIILYISHNESVKKLFDKHIMVKNGVIQ